MATLIVHSGKHRGRKVQLPSTEVVIGRDPDCFIRLASTEVSRKHCSLLATPRGIRVTDLQSSNGTWVNNHKIVGDVILEPGDILRVGTMEFEVPGGKKTVSIDSDILGWLSDEETAHGARSAIEGDTTVISDVKQLQPANAGPAPPPPSKSHFASVAEEAQDIIRRHLQWLEEKRRWNEQQQQQQQ